MRITDIEVIRVTVPFRSTYSWASGTRSGTSRIITVVHTDAGLTGVGETFRLPFVDAVLDQLVQLVIGEEVHDLERIHRKILGAGYYHHHRAVVFASCGIEMALWDLIGKAADVPLYKLLGGGFRKRVEMIGYLFTQDPEALLRETRAYLDQGFRTIKIKIGTDPRQDVALVRLLRDELGYDFELRVDLNQAWTIGTAKRILRRLEPYDLQYAEQPLLLSELDASGDLRRMTSVPIALDESAYTTHEVLEIVRRKAADVILVDPHEAGGLLPCKKACAIAEAAGIPVGVHSASELGVSTAAYLHLAASTPNMLYAVDTQYQHLTDDVITRPFIFHEGALSVPEGPGLGVELDPSKVERYRTDELALPYLRQDDPGWFSNKPEY
jgi:L-rhamnonate dehydratase